MKRNFLFVILLAGLSAISGILMSKASWIGRVGISLLHKELNLLKIWWQGGLAVFLVLLILFSMQSFIYRKSHIVLSRMLQIFFLLLAMGGAYLTYDDFTTDFSHHLMGWRFHMGFYLFWGEWALVSSYLLSKPKIVKVAGAPKAQGDAPTGQEQLNGTPVQSNSEGVKL